MLKDFTLQPLLKQIGSVCSEDTAASLHFPLTDCSMYMTADPEEIIRRQKMFRMLLSDPVLVCSLEEAEKKLDTLAEIARKIGTVQNHSNEELLYALVELICFVDAVELLDSAYSTAETVKSEVLLTFFRAIRSLSEDIQYTNLKNWLYSLENNMRTIRSLTLGVNLDAQLNVSEVGLVSINDQPYVSSRFLDRALHNETPPPEFSCIAAVGLRETGSILQKSQIVINREFYSTMNEITGGTLKQLRKYLTAEMQGTLNGILMAAADLRFILNAVRYMQKLRETGLPLTYPAVSREVRIQNLYNPLLTEKIPVKNIVPSTLTFCTDECIGVLTGPNAGGKTVYLTAIGHAQICFQLGLPVCAAAAEMNPYDFIQTHFVAAVVQRSESRLVNETIRLKEILETLTSNTLFLLDETFSSTSAYDGLYLAETLLKYLLRTGCHCLYVTHLHSLAERITEMRKNGENRVKMLSAEAENGRRTYRIVVSEGDIMKSSLAEDIIRENGLGFLLNA